MAEPLSTAAALGISAGISALGSAGGAFASGNLNRKNRNFTREENEKSRQFNAEQAKLAYERQREFYDYQQQLYTSPSAQMRQLKEAGLNPDMVYGNGAFQSVLPPSVQSASSSSGSSPQSFDIGASLQRGSSELSSMFLNKAQREANVQNTNSDTNLKNKQAEESVTKAKDNMVLVDLHGQQVNLTKNMLDLPKEQIAQLRIQNDNLIKQRDVMDAEIAQLNANASFLNASAEEKRRLVKEMIDTYNSRFDMLSFSARDLKAQCDIDEQHARLFYETFGAQVLRIQSEARSADYTASMQFWESEYKEKLMTGLSKDGRMNMSVMIDTAISIMTNNAAMLEKQYDLLRTYGATHEILNMVNETVKSVSDAFGSLKGSKAMPYHSKSSFDFPKGSRNGAPLDYSYPSFYTN